MRASGLQRSDRTGAVRGAWLPALLLIVPGVVAGLYWRAPMGRPAVAERGTAIHATAWSQSAEGSADANAPASPIALSAGGSTREPVPGHLRRLYREQPPEESHPDPLAVFVEDSEAGLEAGDAEWLAGYRALAASGGLDEVALSDLGSPVDTTRKAALLRVLFEVDSSVAPEAFRWALTQEAQSASRATGTVDLATFAIHHLEQRAQREPRARALLRDTLRTGAAGGTRLELRCRAARTLGRTTPTPEFGSLAELFAVDAEPAVLQAAFTGLSQNSDAVREPGPFRGLGFVAPERIDTPRTEP